MLRRRLLALGAIELLLMVAGAWAFAGGAGVTPVGAAVAGLLVMSVFTVPATALLLWGREGSHALFLTTVGVAALGKMAFLGLALLYLVLRSALPRLEFVLGLLAGWVMGFVALAWLLRGTIVQVGAVDASQR